MSHQLRILMAVLLMTCTACRTAKPQESQPKKPVSVHMKAPVQPPLEAQSKKVSSVGVGERLSLLIETLGQAGKSPIDPVETFSKAMPDHKKMWRELQFPKQAVAQVVSLQTGHLLAAVVLLTDPGEESCGIPSDAVALGLAVTKSTDTEKDKLVVTSLEITDGLHLFGGDPPVATFPEGLKPHPFFVVQYSISDEHPCAEERNQPGGDYQGSFMMVFTLTAEGMVRTETIVLKQQAATPGHFGRTETRVRWSEMDGRVFCALSEFQSSDNFDTNGETNKKHFSCSLESQVLVYQNDSWEHVKGPTLETLQKSVPALRRLPAPRRSTQKSACEKMELTND